MAVGVEKCRHKFTTANAIAAGGLGVPRVVMT